MSIEPAAPAEATIQLLRDGDETFPAWLDAIRGARDEVLLEMYWFDSDRTGREFASALIDRARAGVEVLARIEDGRGHPDAVGRIVAVRQGPLMATSFHPEVGEDLRIHRLFVDLVKQS